MADKDLELAQLLCTRLCHDLAGPIGAVAAGVELIGDDPAMADAETISLIGDSSGAASRKLRFLRAALGATQSAPSDLSVLLDGYIAAASGPGAGIEVAWPDVAAMENASRVFGSKWTQALLNLCLLALEMQPGCRKLAIELGGAAGLTLTVSARTGNGRVIAPREDLRHAALGTADATLSAKTIQAHVAARMIRAAGGTFGFSSLGDGIAVSASMPAV